MTLMPQILLLRGVNVGGVKLAMADLRGALTDAGAHHAETHIQSGNAVFTGPVEPQAIADALERRSGLRPPLFIYPLADFAALAQSCPFQVEDGARVHFFFLSQPAGAIEEKMMPFVTTEKFVMTDRVLYLYSPDGIGRSVLGERLPRILAAPMTARNRNTVQALVQRGQNLLT